MSDRHLTIVPPTDARANGAPPDTPHPVEVARRALREAAMAERDPEWSARFRRVAAALPHRPWHGA